ncbi:hypothetical protein L210DRAFT_802594, partial [Boletus edulis BED1]
RHSVRRQWNEQMARTLAKRNNATLFICKANDNVNGLPLTLSEKFAVVSKQSKGQGRQDERGCLPNIVELAIGMQVMVMLNVETGLDVANGSRGEIVGIILHRMETSPPTSLNGIVELNCIPAAILVKMQRTK